MYGNIYSSKTKCSLNLAIFILLKKSAMQSSFVYILECADRSFYTGVTADLYKRLEEHQEGKHFGSYTFSRRPVSLVYYAHFMDIEQAITFEKKIEKWSRAKKQSLIDGRFEDLPNLAKKNFGD